MLATTRTQPTPVAQTVVWTRLLSVAIATLGIGLIAIYMARFAVRNAPLQWDLRGYLGAARAALAGFDPYDSARISAAAGRPIQPFVYPPIALAPFLAMSAMRPAIAAWVWMLAKLGAFSALIMLWRRWLPTRTPMLSFVLVLIAVFGWSAASLSDLRTGNVALFECALLWAAFECFVRGRRALFGGFVVAAACFKLMPAAFLVLLLVPGEGRWEQSSPRRLFVSLVALAFFVGAPLVIGPASHWARFFTQIPTAATLGPSNPSAFGLLTVMGQDYGLDPAGVTRLATFGWAAYALAVLALGVPFFRAASRDRDMSRWVVGAVFLYVLLSPRPMSYGFLLLGPAPLFLSLRGRSSTAFALLLAAALSIQGLFIAAQVAPETRLAMYSPILFAFCLWALLANSARGVRSSAATARAPSHGIREQAA